MTKEEIIKKYESRIALLSKEHDKMQGLQLTPLREIAKLLEISYSEILIDVKNLNVAIVSGESKCVICDEFKPRYCQSCYEKALEEIP